MCSLEDMCCLCVKESNLFFHFCDRDENNLRYVDILKSLFPDIIIPKYDISMLICATCWKILRDTKNFKEQCVNSLEIWKNCVQSKNEESLLLKSELETSIMEDHNYYGPICDKNLPGEYKTEKNQDGNFSSNSKSTDEIKFSSVKNEDFSVLEHEISGHAVEMNASKDEDNFSACSVSENDQLLEDVEIEEKLDEEVDHPFSCKVCKKILSSHTNLTLHMMRHKDRKPARARRTKRRRRIRLRNLDHDEEDWEPNLEQNNEVDNKRDDGEDEEEEEEEVQIIIPSSNESSSYKCRLCNRKLTNLKNLQRHLLRHIEKKDKSSAVHPVWCPKKSVVETESYFADKIDNFYVCKKCNKQLANFASLQRHMLTHTDLDPLELIGEELGSLRDAGCILRNTEVHFLRDSEVPLEDNRALRDTEASSEDSRTLRDSGRNLKDTEAFSEDSRTLRDSGRNLKDTEVFLEDKHSLRVTGRDLRDGDTGVFSEENPTLDTDCVLRDAEVPLEDNHSLRVTGRDLRDSKADLSLEDTDCSLEDNNHIDNNRSLGQNESSLSTNSHSLSTSDNNRSFEDNCCSLVDNHRSLENSDHCLSNTDKNRSLSTTDNNRSFGDNSRSLVDNNRSLEDSDNRSSRKTNDLQNLEEKDAEDLTKNLKTLENLTTVETSPKEQQIVLDSEEDQSDILDDPEDLSCEIFVLKSNVDDAAPSGDEEIEDEDQKPSLENWEDHTQYSEILVEELKQHETVEEKSTSGTLENSKKTADGRRVTEADEDEKSSTAEKFANFREWANFKNSEKPGDSCIVTRESEREWKMPRESSRVTGGKSTAGNWEDSREWKRFEDSKKPGESSGVTEEKSTAGKWENSRECKNLQDSKRPGASRSGKWGNRAFGLRKSGGVRKLSVSAKGLEQEKSFSKFSRNLKESRDFLKDSKEEDAPDVDSGSVPGSGRKSSSLTAGKRKAPKSEPLGLSDLDVDEIKEEQLEAEAKEEYLEVEEEYLGGEEEYLEAEEEEECQKEAYRCKECNQQLSSNYSLQRHILLLHTPEFKASDKSSVVETASYFVDKEENLYICKTCGKQLAGRQSLQRHMVRHSGVKRFMCTVCGRKLFTRSELISHMVSHQEDNPFPCPICKKSFKNRNRLKTHMKTHSEDKPHMCDICGKKFLNTGRLDRHMTVHSETEPFECKMCKKKYRGEGSLRIHMYMHMKREFKCEICKEVFLSYWVYVQHKKKKHSEKKAQPPPERRFPCTECEKAFRTRSVLKKHMVTHTGEQPYQCKLCGRKFNQSGALGTHMRLLHTSERPYRCKLCHKGFTKANLYDIHMKKQHKRKD